MRLDRDRTGSRPRSSRGLAQVVRRIGNDPFLLRPDAPSGLSIKGLMAIDGPLSDRRGPPEISKRFKEFHFEPRHCTF